MGHAERLLKWAFWARQLSTVNDPVLPLGVQIKTPTWATFAQTMWFASNFPVRCGKLFVKGETENEALHLVFSFICPKGISGGYGNVRHKSLDNFMFQGCIRLFQA